ncbi:MAG: hypothetical protein ACRC0A_01190 [Chitinophagaceae bacterium]
MSWFQSLFLEHGVAQTIVVFGLVVTVGFWLGRIKIFGISLGVIWDLILRYFSLFLWSYCIKGLSLFP